MRNGQLRSYFGPAFDLTRRRRLRNEPSVVLASSFAFRRTSRRHSLAKLFSESGVGSPKDEKVYNTCRAIVSDRLSRLSCLRKLGARSTFLENLSSPSAFRNSSAASRDLPSAIASHEIPSNRLAYCAAFLSDVANWASASLCLPDFDGAGGFSFAKDRSCSTNREASSSKSDASPFHVRRKRSLMETHESPSSAGGNAPAAAGCMRLVVTQRPFRRGFRWSPISFLNSRITASSSSPCFLNSSFGARTSHAWRARSARS